ncbi:MAG: OmpA family protein [Muribaculaceae bacterium]
MKARNIFFSITAVSSVLFMANTASAQDALVVEEISVTETPVDCGDHYSSSWRDNWFIQLGAGIQMPLVENSLTQGDAKRHITLAMNLGVGKWFSPYMGWRFSALGGAIHWDSGDFSKAKYVNLNLDFMWDMLNSAGGVNTKRIFSIVPFVGLGATHVWDMQSSALNISGKDGIKHRTFAMPVSAGIQFRFRLCNYADFFVEARSQFYGDNFNGVACGKPIDINVSAIGGFTIRFTGTKFNTYNPCTYLNYINQLNNQVNALREEVGATAAALAIAESQLPCPQVTQVPCPEVQASTPMLTSVRFALNSSVITNMEMINVYNVAEWLKANPNAKLSINGYADKDTGTSKYNETLSQHRAKAVEDALVKYGVNVNRLTIKAHGSEMQPYDINNWNRIVLFVEK